MNKIKAKRKQVHLTQHELSIEMNVARSTVAMWEIGKSVPRASKLKKLAKILKCDVIDLI